MGKRFMQLSNAFKEGLHAGFDHCAVAFREVCFRNTKMVNYVFVHVMFDSVGFYIIRMTSLKNDINNCIGFKPRN